MNRKKIFMLIILALTTVWTVSAKPKIRILATGGTIAGVAASSTSTAYTAGQATIETLLAAVPEIKELAEISGEQISSIGSQDMNDEIWLKLVKRINQLLNEEGYDAVLITHGTDTMEETAYFLNLTVKSDKPVVLVGAMRSSSAISADGPANLYNGVVACADPASKGHGVMCCMNNQLIDAKDVIKRHTTDCATFVGGTFGSIGYVYGNRAYYYREVTAKHTTQSVFDVTNITKLPQVGIVYGYANCSPLPFKAFMDAKFDGIVLAGVGDGNFYKDVFPYAEQAVKDGIIVVRSSRCPVGPTCLNGEVDDEKYHFCASLNLNPQKSRILLMLALTKTHDWRQIQKYFEEY